MHRISPAHTRYEAKAPRTPLRIESATPTIKPISAHLPIALARTGVVFWKHRNRIRPITGNKTPVCSGPSTVYPPTGLPAPAPRSRSSGTRPPRRKTTAAKLAAVVFCMKFYSSQLCHTFWTSSLSSNMSSIFWRFLISPSSVSLMVFCGTISTCALSSS